MSTPAQVRDFVAPFQEDFAGAVDRFARSLFPPDADPQLVDRVAADMAAAPRQATLGSIGRALNREPPLSAALGVVDAPVVAINPDIAPTDVDSLRRHGVDRTVVLRGVGHFLMLEDPPQCNRALAEVIASFGS